MLSTSICNFRDVRKRDTSCHALWRVMVQTKI